MLPSEFIVGTLTRAILRSLMAALTAAARCPPPREARSVDLYAPHLRAHLCRRCKTAKCFAVDATVKSAGVPSPFPHRGATPERIFTVISSTRPIVGPETRRGVRRRRWCNRELVLPARLMRPVSHTKARSRVTFHPQLGGKKLVAFVTPLCATLHCGNRPGGEARFFHKKALGLIPFFATSTMPLQGSPSLDNRFNDNPA